MRITTRHWATAATVALAATLLPVTAAEASTVGGPISGQEAHDRAQYWVDQHVPYNQSGSYRDPDGRLYREDCSGYVSMAWHLPESANTASLLNYADRLGSLDDLQQGDAIDRTGVGDWSSEHVVLFDHWANSAHTTAYVYSEPQPGSFAEFTTYSRSYLTSMSYTPIRYRNITASLDPANVPDRTVFRESSGLIAVADGGAPFRFGSMDEFHQAGYADGQWTNVPAGFADRMAQTPRPGTVLRNPAGGGLYVIAGGAKLLFTSLDDYHNAGYGDGSFVNVPGSALDRISTTPADGTLLRTHAGGGLYVFAGGAKLQFSTMEELAQAGYPANGFVNAPTDYLASLGSVPTTNLVVRTASDGGIYAVAGGAKFRFASMDDFHNAGYADGQWVSVPTAPIAALGTQPADRALVRDPAGGAIYVVAGGAKQWFDNWDEYVALGYADKAWVSLPGGVAGTLGDTPKDGTIVRGLDGKIYVVAGGAKFWFQTGDEYTAAGHHDGEWINVSTTALSRLKAVPADGTLLKQSGATQIWKVTGGKRTPVATGTATTVSAAALAALPVA